MFDKAKIDVILRKSIQCTATQIKLETIIDLHSILLQSSSMKLYDNNVMKQNKGCNYYFWRPKNKRKRQRHMHNTF